MMYNTTKCVCGTDITQENVEDDNLLELLDEGLCLSCYKKQHPYYRDDHEIVRELDFNKD